MAAILISAVLFLGACVFISAALDAAMDAEGQA